MYRRHRVFSVFLAMWILSIFCISVNVYAELTVQIVRQPNIEKILLEKGPKRIGLTARSTQQNVTFAWEHDGPGKLQGDLSGPGIFYLPPPDIEQQSVRVEIAVIVTDTEGHEASDRITFTLVSSQPPPPPPPTPPPSPPPPPSPDPLDAYLEQGDACFARRWFTTPVEENAFKHYTAALELEPTNRHAREKLYEILGFYKHWGDAAYNQKNCDKVQGYYERYEFVATYLVKTFGDQSLQQEVHTLRQRSENCTAPTPSPQCPPDTRTFEEILQQTLSVNLDMYKNLKHEEKQGIERNSDMIAVIHDIICDFLAIEAILQANYEQTRDEAVLLRVQKTRATRQNYEKELLDRMGESTF